MEQEHDHHARGARDARPARPLIPVRVESGKVVNVRVCWDADKVAAYLNTWPDGIADLATMARPDYKATGTKQELAWIAARAHALAGESLQYQHPTHAIMRPQLPARRAREAAPASPPVRARPVANTPGRQVQQPKRG